MSKHMILLLTNFDGSLMDINKFHLNFMSRVKPLNSIKHFERIDGPRGGVNWAFFEFLKQYKATLAYAILLKRFNSPRSKELTRTTSNNKKSRQ